MHLNPVHGAILMVRRPHHENYPGPALMTLLRFLPELNVRLFTGEELIDVHDESPLYETLTTNDDDIDRYVEDMNEEYRIARGQGRGTEDPGERDALADPSPEYWTRDDLIQARNHIRRAGNALTVVSPRNYRTLREPIRPHNRGAILVEMVGDHIMGPPDVTRAAATAADTMETAVRGTRAYLGLRQDLGYLGTFYLLRRPEIWPHAVAFAPGRRYGIGNTRDIRNPEFGLFPRLNTRGDALDIGDNQRIIVPDRRIVVVPRHLPDPYVPPHFISPGLIEEDRQARIVNDRFMLELENHITSNPDYF